MKVLITGCDGFIGSHLTLFLLDKGIEVVGVDIKDENLHFFRGYPNFKFYKEDLCATKTISSETPDKVIHLGGLGGVRGSLSDPQKYQKVNVGGFINVLEECVKNDVKMLIYASSSSVYGLNKNFPFSEDDKTDTCNSPYACTKLAMEIYAKMYFQVYKLNSIGLRFFTVYGPRGRKDMAPYKFMKNICEGKEIEKFGDGTSSRDYTYVSDIVDGIYGALMKDKGCEIYNLGNDNPVSLNKFIETCEKVIGKRAIVKTMENQPGDVPHTRANIDKATLHLGYQPKISLEEGLIKMI
jgi:UDP-glucuronate 4-epimerase